MNASFQILHGEKRKLATECTLDHASAHANPGYLMSACV